MFNEVSTFSCSNHQSPEIQSIEKVIHYCVKGCGNEAHFKLSNGKWYCSKRYNLCPVVRKKNSDKVKENHKCWKISSFSVEKFIEICPICKKELYTNKNSITRHINACKRKEENKLKIYKKICPKCSNEFEVNYYHRKNVYCSRLCANSIGGKFNKNKKKIVKCKYCNNNIKIGINATKDNHICKLCIPKYYRVTERTIKKKRKCKICGQLDCIQPDICKRRQIIPALIKYFNFDKCVLGTLKVIDEFNRIKDMLYKDYYVDNLSLEDMRIKYMHYNIGNFVKILSF